MGSGSQVFFKSLKFGPGQYQVPDFALDVALGFSGQVVQVIVVDISHQQQVNDAGKGKIAAVLFPERIVTIFISIIRPPVSSKYRLILVVFGVIQAVFQVADNAAAIYAEDGFHWGKW